MCWTEDIVCCFEGTGVDVGGLRGGVGIYTDTPVQVMGRYSEPRGERTSNPTSKQGSGRSVVDRDDTIGALSVPTREEFRAGRSQIRGELQIDADQRA